MLLLWLSFAHGLSTESKDQHNIIVELGGSVDLVNSLKIVFK